MPGLFWKAWVARLRRAIAQRGTYALETTLGGDTIVALLMDATAAGLDVNVWFVGLDSVELHVARVQQRVARGGHDIPRADIERRIRPHVGGDVGDGDPADPAARVARVVVRFGEHRVVVVAGVGRVDGDQRDLAQVGALAQASSGGTEALRSLAGLTARTLTIAQKSSSCGSACATSNDRRSSCARRPATVSTPPRIDRKRSASRESPATVRHALSTRK